MADRRFFAPEVIQTSEMDCGPATLKCLLEGFSISASYGRLREACQTDVDGTSIDTIEEVAVQLGLVAEQDLAELERATYEAYTRDQLIQLVQVIIEQCRPVELEFAGEIVVPLADFPEAFRGPSGGRRFQQSGQRVRYPLQRRVHDHRLQSLCEPVAHQLRNRPPAGHRRDAGAPEFHHHPVRSRDIRRGSQSAAGFEPCFRHHPIVVPCVSRGQKKTRQEILAGSLTASGLYR